MSEGGKGERALEKPGPWLLTPFPCSEEDLPFLVCHVHLLTDDGRPADMLSPTTSPQRTASRRESGSLEQSSPSSLGVRPHERPSPHMSRTSSSTYGPPAPLSSSSTSSSQSVRMLYGTLVASPLQMLHTNERPATMFVFPEISIRSRGRFCLRISLRRVPL